MTAHDYQVLLEIAKRYTRKSHEAEDLLQDALLAAVNADRFDFSQEDNQKWMHGVLRNLAKQHARSAQRRKSRDSSFGEKKDKDIDLTSEEVSVSGDADALQSVLGLLGPASKKVAVLSMQGLNRKEICDLLDISDATLRQRLASIRRALGLVPDALKHEAVAMAYVSRQKEGELSSDLPLGLIRKALIRRLKDEKSKGHHALGTHDPSGHLIIIRKSE